MKPKWIVPAVVLGFLIGCNMLSRPVTTAAPSGPAVASSPELSYAVSACNDQVKIENANLVTITSTGSQVLIEQDAGYVCCAKIAMQVQLEGSLLKIIETNTGDMCKCICGYHASAQVSGLASGSYHVQVWGIQFKDVQDMKLLGEADILITSQKTYIIMEVPTNLPDLTADNYSVRYFGCPWSDPGEVRGWVMNNGDGHAGPFQVEINGETTMLPGLMSGLGVWASVPFASGPVGGVNINVDPSNQVQETDKNNNQYHIVFTPPPTCVTATPGGALPLVGTPTLSPMRRLVFKVAAVERWNMPDVEIHKGDTVQIRYTGGKWTYNPDLPPFDGNGFASKAACGSRIPGARCKVSLPYAPIGALIATYDNPAYFLIGNGFTFIAPEDGFLNLKMNATEDENGLAKRSGELEVEITIRK